MRRHLMLFGLAAVCIFAVSLASAVEEGDILVYYSFDKLSGNTFEDGSGNGNDAELVGKGSLVDGQFKKAVRLNGGIVQMEANDFIVPIGEKAKLRWRHGSISTSTPLTTVSSPSKPQPAAVANSAQW